jgi:hypothetical protein
MTQSLLYLTIALHVSCVTITYLQEHKSNQFQLFHDSSTRTYIIHYSTCFVCHYHPSSGAQIKSVPTLPRQQYAYVHHSLFYMFRVSLSPIFRSTNQLSSNSSTTAVRVRTSFIILYNLLHFPQNIHYSTIILI